MDYESRVTKVETLVETIRKDIDRLLAADDGLRKLILERTEHLDNKIETVRKEGIVHFRWTIAMFFTILGLIGGLYGKLFGLY